MLPDYKALQVAAGSASYVRRMSGDTFTVSLEKLGDGPPLKVRVVLVAAAD